VGPGVRLELFDVAGTLAHDGRGAAAGWHVRAAVATGSRLRWSGAPFVVADGARVRRELAVDLDEAAELLLRETLVLGRSGQRGGAVRSRTVVRRDGVPALVEDLDLDPDGHRELPGMLGSHRLLDSVLAVGGSWEDLLPAPRPAAGDDLAAFRLAGGAGTLLRHLGHDLATSPLHRLWAGTRPGPGAV
jgi:urease accessory protein